MTLELATQGQSVQRSPPPPSIYKKNLHCRRHFFKENSQEKRAVPFPSLSISLKRLPKTTPYTLGLSVMRERLIFYSLAGCLSPAESHSLLHRACVRLKPSSLEDAACKSTTRQRILSKSGNGQYLSLLVLTCEFSCGLRGYHGT